MGAFIWSCQQSELQNMCSRESVCIWSSTHAQKVEIWLAISWRRVIGPIFVQRIITSEVLSIRCFMGSISPNAWWWLADRILRDQKDETTTYTANASITCLQEFYADCVTYRNLWHPHSSDLTPLEFYFFGRIKNIFKNRKIVWSYIPFTNEKWQWLMNCKALYKKNFSVLVKIWNSELIYMFLSIVNLR